MCVFIAIKSIGGNPVKKQDCSKKSPEDMSINASLNVRTNQISVCKFIMSQW